MYSENNHWKIVSILRLHYCYEIRHFSGHSQRLGHFSESEILSHMSHIHVTSNHGLHLHVQCRDAEFPLSKSIHSVDGWIHEDGQRGVQERLSADQGAMFIDSEGDIFEGMPTMFHANSLQWQFIGEQLIASMWFLRVRSTISSKDLSRGGRLQSFVVTCIVQSRLLLEI